MHAKSHDEWMNYLKDSKNMAFPMLIKRVGQLEHDLNIQHRATSSVKTALSQKEGELEYLLQCR